MNHNNRSSGNLSADEKIVAACNGAGEQAILRAEQTGTHVVIWRDGKVVHLTAAEARRQSEQKKVRSGP